VWLVTLALVPQANERLLNHVVGGNSRLMR